MINYIATSDGLADISDAAGTDMYLYDAPFAGKIRVDRCYVKWNEATGSQSSAQGTILLKVGGTTVGTMTAPVSGAVGDTTAFAVDGTNSTAANPWYSFAAGAVILFEIGTQACGGGVTGDGEIHIAFAYADGV